MNDPHQDHSRLTPATSQSEDLRLRLAAIVDSSDDAIISKDLDGVICTWNPAAHRLFGYSELEAIGRPITLIIPADLQNEEKEILRRVRSGDRVDHYETRRVTRDGRLLDVSITVSPLRDSRGTIVGASKILRDITERNRAHSALRESEERFRRIANAAPVTIWMSNVSNQWTYVNQTWLDFSGHSFEAALAAGWANGIHPDDVGRCVKAYAAAFERQERFQMEYRLRRYDGEYRSIVATGVPACDADGLFTGYIGCAIDLTERRLAEEALSKLSHRLLNAQDEERARVARELHDDIGQRLVLLNISIDILLKDADCDPETSRRIEEAREHVVGLVNDVRAYSHRLHPWRLQYLGIAKAAAALCREMAAQHDVEVSFHADSSSEGLSKRISMCLYRVLQEALQNAIKHSGTLKIDVSLGSDGDEIELSVQDFGIGFNAETTGGFGLGLTSIKERVTALGGQLAVLPAPQHGTTIRVRVPLQDVDVTWRHDGAPLK